jgi:RNA polymerase sigma factor (sigma-70 family)
MGKLTEEQRQLAADNHDIIYYCLNKNNWRVEDYYDIAAIALCQAAKMYDPQKSQFPTFANGVIKNFILNEIKTRGRMKRQGNVVSYDDPCGDSGTYRDLLSEKKSAAPDPEERAICLDILKTIAHMKPKLQQMLMLKYQGYSISEIMRIQGRTYYAVVESVKRAKKRLTEDTS